MEDKTKYMESVAQSSGLEPVSDIDEQLVRQFFAEQTAEIPDNGFTQRVISRLPRRSEQRLNRLWTALCTLAGVILFMIYTMIVVVILGITSHELMEAKY